LYDGLILAEWATPNRPAAALPMLAGDGEKLEQMLRSPAESAQRARMVLLAADGVSNTEIGRLVGASRQGLTASGHPASAGPSEGQWNATNWVMSCGRDLQCE
jgi:hypothetical protein